jgi:hypothetical protein
MSLITDAIFVKALRSNASLIASLPAGDVYNTAIALPEEEADNAPVPYIIVSFNGLNNQDTTKDMNFDGLTDMVTIGIEIAAETRPQLGNLAIAIRNTIRDYFQQLTPQDEDYALLPNAYTMQAQPVQYDSLKPCYWQQIAFMCDTNPD